MIINTWGEKHDVTPRVELYSVQDYLGNERYGLAVLLEENMEPFCDLTVSFGEFISLKNCAYIDVNNCPFTEQFLQMGVAEDTGLTKRSGFCQYPLWRFSEEFLKENGLRNYNMYSEAYDCCMGNR